MGGASLERKGREMEEFHFIGRVSFKQIILVPSLLLYVYCIRGGGTERVRRLWEREKRKEERGERDSVFNP